MLNAIQNNKIIQHVTLRNYNELKGDEAADAICQMLKTNKSLLSLKLRGIYFTPINNKRILLSVEEHSKLLQFVVSELGSGFIREYRTRIYFVGKTKIEHFYSDD